MIKTLFNLPIFCIIFTALNIISIVSNKKYCDVCKHGVQKAEMHFYFLPNYVNCKSVGNKVGNEIILLI